MSIQDQTDFAKMLAQFKNRGQGQNMINGPMDALIGSAFPETYNAAAQALGYQQPPQMQQPPQAPQSGQMTPPDPSQSALPDPTGQPPSTMDNISMMMGKDPKQMQALMQAGQSCCAGGG